MEKLMEIQNKIGAKIHSPIERGQMSKRQIQMWMQLE
jgi:hypothetical protein